MPTFNTVVLIDNDGQQSSPFQVQGTNWTRIDRKVDRIRSHFFFMQWSIKFNVPRDIRLPLVTYSPKNGVRIAQHGVTHAN